MADNESTGTGKPIATYKVTHSGDADQNVQIVTQGVVTGAEGSRTVADVAVNTGVVGATVPRVTLATNDAAVTALQLLDDAINAANTVLSKAITIAGVMDDSGPVVATEGNVSAVRVTPYRALHVSLYDALGVPLTGASPTTQVHKAFNATTLQTGAAVWTPTATKKIAITSLVISTYGTTAGRILLWFGGAADTTYTAGTDQLVVPFNTAPTSTAKPGLVYAPTDPIYCVTADHVLRVTTDTAVSLDIVVEGFEYV